MRWAVAFFPCHIRQLMNLLASTELYRGSGFKVVALAVRFPAISILCLLFSVFWLLRRSLRPVLGAGLFAVGNALGIEDAADNVIAHAGQIADAPAAHQHDRVFLEVVPFAGDVRGH